MKILFAIGEADPFAKTGGLGDVGGSLPGAINQAGGKIRVIMPKYEGIPQELLANLKFVADFQVELGWRRKYCGLLEMEYEGVHYYFIDNEYYFKREKLYGYEDDGERFAFFARGVLDSLPHLKGFQPDIIHCNDWHTALIPVMLKEFCSCDPYYYNIRSLFTIHNLKHQGIFPREMLGDLLNLEGSPRARESLAFDGAVNYLKGALLYADQITTVSPSYAQEIQEPFYGEGLEQVLRDRREGLIGILNGIDYDRYNPETDPYIFANYATDLAKKNQNKKQIQKLLELPEGENIPLLAMVSRLDGQKGLDLLAHIMEELLQEDLQLVVLGTGEEKYETMLSHFAAQFPDKLAAKIAFDDSLAHKIYAGADLLLMPSLFEPCGLGQMIAMRYGTIPLVRETGGLKDTVFPYNQFTGKGNGFSFANYNAHEFLFTIQKALRIYRDNKMIWQKLQEEARQKDFSWRRSAREYFRLYETMIAQPF